MENIQISGKYSRDELLLKELKASGLPVFLYGIGLIADTTQLCLHENGLQIAGRVIDDKYIPDLRSRADYPLLSISQLNRQHPAFNVLLCFFGGYRNDLSKYRELFPGAKIISFLSSIYDRGVLEPMDSDFVTSNIGSFNRVCELLEDKLSKDSLEAYINAKVTKDASHLFPFVRRPQYFSEHNVIKDLTLTREEFMINCGAFTGDTIRDFLEAVGSRYSKIYACEPDSMNVQKLREYIRTVAPDGKVAIIPKCISNTSDSVYFLNEGTMLSRNVETSVTGSVSVESITIDEMLDSSPATLIVMDVEGNELKALQGARQTLLKYRPLLALAAYHKKDDIPVLVDYLKTLVPEYRFYFRVHKPMAIDAVLYASARGATDT
ncbi:MAG: FkbM family methyltransferase [Bacteroidales bacterium]|jgi:FkbM family methyltransferase